MIRASAPLPYRVLVLAELAPRKPEGGAAPPQGPFRLTAQTFDDLMAALVGTVPLLAQSPSAGRIQTEVPLASFAGLRPERIARKLPHLATLNAVRETLAALRDGKASLEETRRALRGSGHPLGGELADALRPAPVDENAPTRVVSPTRAEAEGGIFDLISGAPSDAPAPAGAAERGALDAVRRAIAGIASGAKVRSGSEKEAAREAIEAVDAVWSAELAAVLGHPEFRRLETLWRGVRFFLERAELTDDVRVEVVSASRADAPELLAKLGSEADDSGAEEAVGLVIADYDWDTSGASWTALRGLARAAAEMPAPLVTSVGPAFFGKADLESVIAIEDLDKHFEGEDYKKWQGLRDDDESAWLTLVLNRFPLRYPHGEATEGKDGPRYREGDAWLFGNAVWGVGALPANAFARTAWPCDLLGPDPGGRLGGLPIRPVKDRSGTERQIGLEAHVHEDVRRAFNRAGFSILSDVRESDEAVFVAAPAAHAGGRHADQGRDRLPYRAFTTRAAQFVRFVAESMGPVGSEEEAMLQMAAGMSALLGGSPREEGYMVQAGRDPDRGNRIAITVSLDPRGRVPGGGPPAEITVWTR